jgi:hypothetical protein
MIQHLDIYIFSWGRASGDDGCIDGTFKVPCAKKFQFEDYEIPKGMNGTEGSHG